MGQVYQGMERTFRHRDSNFEYTVVGDGKLEKEVMDRFQSPCAVQSFEDTRLQRLASDVAALFSAQRQDNWNQQYAGDSPSKVDQLKQQGKGDPAELLANRLGQPWKLGKFEADTGEWSIPTFVATLVGNEARMSVKIDAVGGVRLSSFHTSGEWTIHQTISRDSLSQEIVEEVYLSRAGIEKATNVFPPVMH